MTLLTALFYSPPSPPQNGLKVAYRVTLKHRVNLKEVGLVETRHRDGSQHPEASMTASVDLHRWATGQGLSFLAARGKKGHRPSEEPAERGLGCVLEQPHPHPRQWHRVTTLFGAKALRLTPVSAGLATSGLWVGGDGLILFVSVFSCGELSLPIEVADFA